MESNVAPASAQAIHLSASSSSGELSVVLRDGRVLAGQVVETATDGKILVTVGKHRIAAQTSLLLEAGQAFLFRVEQQEGGTIFHVLGQGDPQATALLGALRGVIGQQRPIGELLQNLAASLRARSGTSGFSPEFAKLFESLASHVYSPKGGVGGEELLQLISRSGLRYEGALHAALRARRDLGGAAEGDLKAQLLRALAKGEEGPIREAIRRTLSSLESEQLMNLARQRSGEPFVWSFPLPDGDGWTTATLRIDPRDGGRNREEAEKKKRDEESTSSFTLGVTYRHLGPVRADVTMDEEHIEVRLAASKKPVARMLIRVAEEISGRLSGSGRSVHVMARWAEESRVLAGITPVDVRFLRDNPMMDVSG